MSSIINNNSFTNCKKLKKIYIGSDTVIGALDLSKTQIKDYQEPEKYDKITSKNGIFADQRIIHHTKFPPKDASSQVDFTSKEIEELEKKLENALGKANSNYSLYTTKIGEWLSASSRVAEKQKALEEEIKKNQEIQTALDSLRTELNSSSVDKLALENQLQELNEKLQKIEPSRLLTDEEMQIIKYLNDDFFTYPFHNYMKTPDEINIFINTLERKARELIKAWPNFTPVLGRMYYLSLTFVPNVIQAINYYKTNALNDEERGIAPILKDYFEFFATEIHPLMGWGVFKITDENIDKVIEKTRKKFPSEIISNRDNLPHLGKTYMIENIFKWYFVNGMDRIKYQKKQEIDNLRTELDKEKTWWDKWINDDGLLLRGQTGSILFGLVNPIDGKGHFSSAPISWQLKAQSYLKYKESEETFKKFLKEKIYQYYLNK